MNIRTILNFPGYFISDKGQVYSKWTKIGGKNKCSIIGDKLVKIKGVILRTGYVQISLYKNNKKYQKTIHRLIGESFLNNPNNYKCILHLNDKKDDNRLENLKWGTQSENIKIAYSKGRKTVKCGSKCNLSKLNEKQVKVIKHLKNFEPKLKQWEVAKIFKVSQSEISRIWNGLRFNLIT